jgi:hypothetical protein
VIKKVVGKRQNILYNNFKKGLKYGKRKTSKIKYTSKFISLPMEKWDELEIKAQEQGITKNKLVADLIEKYLKKNRRKNEKNKTKK